MDNIFYIFMDHNIFSDLLYEVQTQFSLFTYKQKRDFLEAITSDSVMLKITYHLLTTKYIHKYIPSLSYYMNKPKMETRARKKKKEKLN